MKTLLACLLLALCVPCAWAADDKTAERPTLAVTTLDGQAWSLETQRGQWVVVNFWATWCSPCIAEMPEIDRFAASRDDVTVIGLAWQDAEPAKVQAFLDEHPVSYPIAIVDPFEPLPDFAAPRGLPTTYIIDPTGKVAEKFIGPVTAKDLLQAIGKPADK